VTGTAATGLEIAVINLMPGATYYYRANATNLAGTVTGTVASFVTLGGLPVISSGAASAITSDAATLSGTVNANSVATQAFFQYSRASDFSTLDGTVVAGDVTGTETATLSAQITGLEPGTTYYWRLAATNTAGTTVGGTQSFATPVFGRSTSLSAGPLLTALVIDRSDVTGIVLSPTTKSRSSCTVNAKTKRLVFGKPGVCRVKIAITRDGDTTTAAYNLVVK
jgi:hypothetical protein